MSKSLRPRDSLLPSRAVSSSIDTMPTPVHADVHCTAGMTSWVWDLPSSGAHSMQHQLFASQGTTWGRTDRDMVGQVFTKQWPIFRRSVGRECLKLSKWLTRSYQLNFRFASSEHKSTLSLVNFRVLWQPFWIFWMRLSCWQLDCLFRDVRSFFTLFHAPGEWGQVASSAIRPGTKRMSKNGWKSNLQSLMRNTLLALRRHEATKSCTLFCPICIICCL